MNTQLILGRINEQDSNIYNIYSYGSRVYGNLRKDSDYDYIIVLKKRKKNQEQFSDRLINVQFYNKEEFQHRLDEHEISALECFFLPQHLILKQEIKFNFKLVLSKLRESLSRKSSNSFVKAFKKLTVEKDYNLLTAQKSLWHSFRIIDFGIQIATSGKIYDYSSYNSMYWDILKLTEWDDIIENYKKNYNELMTRFRITAPKQLLTK